MFPAIIQGITLGFPAAATPGPLQAFMLAQTMRHGWRRTLPAALAPLLSDGPIILLTLLLLAQLPESALRLLQIAGGLFILYLALGALRAFRAADFAAPPAGDAGTLWQATVMNFLNPNPWIFWLTLGSRLLLEHWRRSMGAGLGYLLAFYTALVLTFVLLILLFGVAERFGPRVSRGLTGLSAVALTLFGLHQLAQGVGLPAL